MLGDELGGRVGERRDRRKWKRDIEFEWRTVHAENLRDGLADLPEPVRRTRVDADRGLACQLRALECVGQLLGLIGVARQLDEQLPRPVDWSAHPAVLSGQRAGPR